MGKTPVRLKEVSYALSPMHQTIMRGLLKDVGYKTSKRINENWLSALTLIVPVVGSYCGREGLASGTFYLSTKHNTAVFNFGLSQSVGAIVEVLERDAVKRYAYRYAEHYREMEKLHHRH